MEDLLSKHIKKIIDLSSLELALFEAALECRTLKRNEFLLRSGQIYDHQYFVVKGGLRQFEVDQNGKETIVHFGFENWWMTDMASFYMEEPSKYLIEALEETELIQISRNDLNRLLNTIPKLQYYFHITLQESAVIWQNKILYLQKPAKQRYIMFRNIYGAIEQRISQQHVASYLGISRETLSRVKSQVLRGI